jgi:hypothetical protein
LAKEPRPDRCSRRVTQPPFIAGPLGSKARTTASSVTNDNFFTLTISSIN